MPESKSRKSGQKRSGATAAERRAARPPQADTGPEPLPMWYRIIMFGLMLLGLLWIVVYYITQGLWPIPQAGGWNILIGFGIAVIGFLMTTRWR